MAVKSGRVSFYCFFGGLIVFVLSSYSGLKSPPKNPYKQIHIPLDMQSGVPFSKDHRGEYHIEGFDVDSNENFYFLAGRKATLACIAKTGKTVYRRTFLNHVPGQTYISGGKFYFFEIGDESLNTIVEVDKTNGSVVREYSKTIAKTLQSRGYTQIDYYEFQDSMLKITYIDSEGIDKTKRICFNLKGEVLSDCNAHSSNAIEMERGFRNLGRLGNDYVLGKYGDDGERYLLSLRDSSNRSLSDTFINRNYLGDPLCGDLLCMPPEHRKLRNNKLYMLNRDKNMAEITVIDLAAIFHKAKGS